MNLLKKWGYTPMSTEPLAPGDVPARVIEEHRSQYRIITEDGELLAQVRGNLLKSGDMPLVGDFVCVRPLWAESKGVIQSILPRANLLRRAAEKKTESLAANVDMVFIVTSLNSDYNEKRIDRYLTVINESGSRPGIILTKNDLKSAGEIDATDLEKRFPGVPFYSLSAQSGAGMEEFHACLEAQKTYMFIGSSGVGKSTLVNALLGRQEFATQEIRESDERGRHTTTSRRLVMLASGAMVIDTPGLREIQLSSEQEAGLQHSFPLIEELTMQCKFSNCLHHNEPGCAVKAALETGKLEQGIYDSFLKIQRETAFQHRKVDKSAAAVEKKKWKAINKSQRAHYKNRRSDD